MHHLTRRLIWHQLRRVIIVGQPYSSLLFNSTIITIKLIKRTRKKQTGNHDQTETTCRRMTAATGASISSWDHTCRHNTYSDNSICSRPVWNNFYRFTFDSYGQLKRQLNIFVCELIDHSTLWQFAIINNKKIYNAHIVKRIGIEFHVAGELLAKGTPPTEISGQAATEAKTVPEFKMHFS